MYEASQVWYFVMTATGNSTGSRDVSGVEGEELWTGDVEGGQLTQ